MLIGKPPDIPSSAITSKDQYLNRRRFLRGAVSGAVATGAAALGADRLADVLSPRIGALAGTKLETVKSPLTTTGEQLDQLRRRHPLQQLLRVRREQGRARKECRRSAHAAVDDSRRRQSENAEDLRHRHAAQAAAAGRSRLSPSLRRGLEHGDSLGGLLAFGVHQAVRPALNGEVRAVPLLLRQARGEMVVGPGYLLALLRGTAHGRGHEPADAA